MAVGAKGPASYFPSIEKKHARPIDERLEIVRDQPPARHLELVLMLKTDHEWAMAMAHVDAVVAHVLARDQ